MNKAKEITNYINNLEKELNHNNDVQAVLSKLYRKYFSTNEWYLGIALGQIFTKHGVHLTKNLLHSLKYNGLSSIHFDKRKWLGKYLETSKNKFMYYPDVKKEITASFVKGCLDNIKQNAKKIGKKDTIYDKKYGKNKADTIVPNY